MKILVIDVGGTNVKVLASGQKTPIKIPSGPKMTAQKMVKLVREATSKWRYEAVSIGFPGPVIANRPMREPHNLGQGWVHFDFHRAFRRPTKVMNDAAMQALGSYNKGRMLFLGLGTGLGSAMVFDGVVEPLELAHLPYKKGPDLRGLSRAAWAGALRQEEMAQARQRRRRAPPGGLRGRRRRRRRRQRTAPQGPAKGRKSRRQRQRLHRRLPPVGQGPEGRAVADPGGRAGRAFQAVIILITIKTTRVAPASSE